MNSSHRSIGIVLTDIVLVVGNNIHCVVRGPSIRH